MKPNFIFLAAIPLIFMSCSPYRKVSTSNFTTQEVPTNGIPQLEYVLKRGKLHYEAVYRKIEIRNHYGEDPSRYDSQNLHIMDHIVIPSGAWGTCILAEGNVLVIDFGEGVVVPFLILEKDNRATPTLTLGEKTFKSVKDQPGSRLYFKPGKSRINTKRMIF